MNLEEATWVYATLSAQQANLPEDASRIAKKELKPEAKLGSLKRQVNMTDSEFLDTPAYV